MKYQTLMDRKEALLCKSTGFEYSRFCSGSYAFDYEGMMAPIGYPVGEVRDIQRDALVLDGIYAEDERGKVTFRPVGPPSDAEVARVTANVCRRVLRLMKRRGLSPEDYPDGYDELAHNQPLLSELYGTSIAGRIGFGKRAGRRITRAGDEIDWEDSGNKAIPGCASVSGFSVHAGVGVPADDRMRLERLCRYTGRPPVSTERLSLLPDRRLLYRLKRRWRDGTSHVIFDPLDFIG